MLIKASKTLKKVLPNAIQGIARFCSSKHAKNKASREIDPKLLYPYNKNQTLKALVKTQELQDATKKFDPNRLLILDQLSESSFSETFRAFDRYQKKFVSLKTVDLDFPTSWNQVNLSLRQYCLRKSSLADILSFIYDENTQKLKIISELKNTTIHDYSYYRNKNQIPWTNAELRFIVWNLLNQVNTLSGLQAKAQVIRPKNMFFDDNHRFKVYDFSDFEVIDSLSSDMSSNMDAVIYSLVQVINPYAPVDNVEEAKGFLKSNYPGFLEELGQIQENVTSFNTWPSSKIYTEKILPHIEAGLKEGNMFIEKDYQVFFSERLKDILEAKSLENFHEEWAHINQGLGNYTEAINTLKNCIKESLENQGGENQTSARCRVHLAELYRAMKNFEAAEEVFSKTLSDINLIPEMDKQTIARIYNEYGKFLAEKDQHKDALQYFTKAEQTLQNIPDDSSLLATEVKANLQKAKETTSGSGGQRDKSQHNEKANNQSTDNNDLSVSKILLRLLFFVVSIKLAVLVLDEIKCLIRKYVPDENEVKPTQEPSQSDPQKEKNFTKIQLKQETNQQSDSQPVAQPSDSEHLIDPTLVSEIKSLILGQERDDQVMESSEDNVINAIDVKELQESTTEGDKNNIILFFIPLVAAALGLAI